MSNEEKQLTIQEGNQIESALPPAILRGLGDRSYDKRKNAAIELTTLVRTFQESGEKEKIVNVINVLAQEFVRSRNANHRKGGLIGIAACAIGFMHDTQRYLHLLLPPVLECFDDQESRVCYYACEALYNIAKVSRNSILRYFNQIFDGLCKLFAHVDVDVKNGANLLDRLIKDIVTESETFDIESFIPLLQKHIKRTKPYIRQLLVGWISILNSVPDISMLDYLPEFLDGLFNMLSDGNREIRQGADNVLGDFLREIKQTEVVEFGPMVLILVGQSRSKERFNRLTAIVWLHEFVSLGGTQLVQFFAPILGSIMYCISDQEDEIRNAAKEANQSLLNLVRTTTKEFELGPLLRTLTMELLSSQVTTRVAALSWINMLHEKDSIEMNKYITDLLPALLKTLSDSADEVVLINLQVIARICIDELQFHRVLNSLVQLFSHDRPLLEARGALIIRKLCSLLNCQKIFLSLASIVTKTDPEFSSTMVQTLNLILLTAPELCPLRNTLENSIINTSSSTISETDRYNNLNVFVILFKYWSNNPVSTFSLCLLSQAYNLAAKLILKFSNVDVTIGFLMQIDKLIQLIESPVFLRLRLQLLDVNLPFHGDLLMSLYGLLMLLPQSQAYKTLSDRLNSVNTLKINLIYPLENDSSSSSTSSSSQQQQQQSVKQIKQIKENEENEEEKYNNLLKHFESIQLKYTDHRLRSYEQQKIS